MTSISEKSFWSQPRTLVAYALSLLALAEIVDLTIVAVAVPQIMGSIGADIDSIALVTTSYIVAAAVCILLSGLVIRKFGMRKVTIISAIVFCVSSILCGTSTSLFEMVLFRIIQGIGGAFLPAIAQAYIAQKFKNKEQQIMMTIFSLIVVMGPIIGPILGGALCENMTWRWIFYVNVPICIIALLIIWVWMEKDHVKDTKIDYISFLLMAFGIGLLEYVIDEGNSDNWFESFSIIITFFSSLILLGFFIWRGILGQSIVKLSLFKNYNFVLSCFTMFVFITFATGSLAYFPTMLQQSYNYPVDLAGYITAPRGITAICTALIMPRIIPLIGARMVIFFGMIFFSAGCFLLSSYGPAVSKGLVIFSMILQGIGMMSFFAPIMSIAYVGIADEDSSDASGIFNFFRNFGSSVGTSLAATIISHQSQVNYHGLGGHISPYARGFEWWSQDLSGFSDQHIIAIANQELIKQSSFISYLDSYHLFAIGMLCILWVPLLMKRSKKKETTTPKHH
jgi:DHA2 family multidrug resistance protein